MAYSMPLPSGRVVQVDSPPPDGMAPEKIKLALIKSGAASDADFVPRETQQAQPIAGQSSVPDNSGDIPTLDENGNLSTADRAPFVEQPKPETIQDLAQSGQFNSPVAETALALGTGMTQGALGHIVGALKGLGETILSHEYGTQRGAEKVAKSAQEGAASGTYQPTNPIAQKVMQKIGEAGEILTPLTPMATELGQITRNAAQARLPAKPDNPITAKIDTENTILKEKEIPG